MFAPYLLRIKSTHPKSYCLSNNVASSHSCPRQYMQKSPNIFFASNFYKTIPHPFYDKHKKTRTFANVNLKMPEIWNLI